MMRQPITYVAVGGLTALLYFTVALTASLGLAVAPGWASLAGFIVASPLSYLGHKFLTFRSGGEHRRELPRFAVTAAVGLLISAGVPELVVLRWHEPPAFGYLVACVCVPALNYLLLWLWVFVGRRRPAAEKSLVVPGA